MEKNAKIYVAGHRGLVGSAIVRCLQKNGFCNIVTRSHKELDLTNQQQVKEFFAKEKPDYVFLAAAKVGGIMANNTYPAEFIYQNLMIGCNVIEASYQNGVKKLLNMGSSCIYPRLAPQPMNEEALLTSALEPTNEAYAIAKIATIKLCRYYNQQYGGKYRAGKAARACKKALRPAYGRGRRRHDGGNCPQVRRRLCHALLQCRRQSGRNVRQRRPLHLPLRL